MNIFVLDIDPKIAAQSLCDKHVPKMIVESAQMLCTVFHLQNIHAPYKKTHVNHPCNIWIREAINNYNWLLTHAYEICNEYTFRYGKIHKSQTIIKWCDMNKDLLKFPAIGPTDFVQAMPFQYKTNDTINSYRNYYLNDKSRFAKWNKGRNPPSWWKPLLQEPVQ